MSVQELMFSYMAVTLHLPAHAPQWLPCHSTIHFVEASVDCGPGAAGSPPLPLSGAFLSQQHRANKLKKLEFLAALSPGTPESCGLLCKYFSWPQKSREV